MSDSGWRALAIAGVTAGVADEPAAALPARRALGRAITRRVIEWVTGRILRSAARRAGVAGGAERVWDERAGTTFCRSGVAVTADAGRSLWHLVFGTALTTVLPGNRVFLANAHPAGGVETLRRITAVARLIKAPAREREAEQTPRERRTPMTDARRGNDHGEHRACERLKARETYPPVTAPTINYISQRPAGRMAQRESLFSR